MEFSTVALLGQTIAILGAAVMVLAKQQKKKRESAAENPGNPGEMMDALRQLEKERITAAESKETRKLLHEVVFQLKELCRLLKGRPCLREIQGR
jgi:hypothetical protein